MKRLFIYFLLCGVLGLITSCQPESKEDMLTGGNYKYWVLKSSDWKDTAKPIVYLDKNFKCLLFAKDANGKFARYIGSDIILNEKWYLSAPNIFDMGNRDYELISSTDSIFTFKSRKTTDTLIAAPENLIPESFKKIQ